jgi:hypothetical protein
MISMGKKFQVTEEFLVDVSNLVNVLKGQDISRTASELCKSISSFLNAKLAAIERRQLYGAYKGAEPGSDEREANRQAYLDAAGVHPDWRSQREMREGPEE